MSQYERELSVAIDAACAASAIVSRHYARRESEAPAVFHKGDRSPQTAADRESNEAILSALAKNFPGDAVLSEETSDDGQRLHTARAWIIDPLDGTRDFVAGTGDFSVHVALVEEGRPVVAAVLVPQSGRLFFAVHGEGAFVVQEPALWPDFAASKTPIHVSPRNQISDFRVGISRFSQNAALKRFLEISNVQQKNIVPIGASVKLMALACGDLDACVALHGGEKEWDTCAPALIIREAGGVLTDADGAPLVYNRADVQHRRGVVASNARCHAEIIARTREAFVG